MVNNIQVYLCHDDETCTETCARRRRRSLPEVTFVDETQPNGIPIPSILSQEIVVPDQTDDSSSEDFAEQEKFEKLVRILETRMTSLRKAVKAISNPIQRLRRLGEQ